MRSPSAFSLSWKRLFALCLITCFIFASVPQTSSADTFRPVVRGKRGAVAGGSPLSVEAGLRMLQRGGNAVDAAIAAAAVAAVVMPEMCGLGGDIFAIVHDPATGTRKARTCSSRVCPSPSTCW